MRGVRIQGGGLSLKKGQRVADRSRGMDGGG